MTPRFTTLAGVAIATLAIAYALPHYLPKDDAAEIATIAPAAGEPKPAAEAQAEPSTAIEVVRAWGKPADAAGGMGVAYVAFRNNSDKDVLITQATSPVAERVEFHTHIMDAGIARMRPIQQIVVPAKQTVEMKSGGLHLMLMKLKEPIAATTAYPISFTTLDGKRIEAQVAVE